MTLTHNNKMKCSYCNKKLVLLKGCSSCKNAFYCNRACQARHWTLVHKNECEIKATFNAGKREPPKPESKQDAQFKDIIPTKQDFENIPKLKENQRLAQEFFDQAPNKGIALGMIDNFLRQNTYKHHKNVIDKFADDTMEFFNIDPNIQEEIRQTWQNMENSFKLQLENHLFKDIKDFSVEPTIDFQDSVDKLDILSRTGMKQDSEKIVTEMIYERKNIEYWQTMDMMKEGSLQYAKDRKFTYIKDDDETRRYGFEPNPLYEGTYEEVEERVRTGQIDPIWWNSKYDWLENAARTGRIDFNDLKQLSMIGPRFGVRENSNNDDDDYEPGDSEESEDYDEPESEFVSMSAVARSVQDNYPLAFISETSQYSRRGEEWAENIDIRTRYRSNAEFLTTTFEFDETNLALDREEELQRRNLIQRATYQFLNSHRGGQLIGIITGVVVTSTFLLGGYWGALSFRAQVDDILPTLKEVQKESMSYVGKVTGGLQNMTQTLDKIKETYEIAQAKLPGNVTQDQTLTHIWTVLEHNSTSIDDAMGLRDTVVKVAEFTISLFKDPASQADGGLNMSTMAENLESMLENFKNVDPSDLAEKTNQAIELFRTMYTMGTKYTPIDSSGMTSQDLIAINRSLQQFYQTVGENLPILESVVNSLKEASAKQLRVLQESGRVLNSTMTSEPYKQINLASFIQGTFLEKINVRQYAISTIVSDEILSPAKLWFRHVDTFIQTKPEYLELYRTFGPFATIALAADSNMILLTGVWLMFNHWKIGWIFRLLGYGSGRMARSYDDSIVEIMESLEAQGVSFPSNQETDAEKYVFKAISEGSYPVSNNLGIKNDIATMRRYLRRRAIFGTIQRGLSGMSQYGFTIGLGMAGTMFAYQYASGFIMSGIDVMEVFVRRGTQTGLQYTLNNAMPFAAAVFFTVSTATYQMINWTTGNFRQRRTFETARDAIVAIRERPATNRNYWLRRTQRIITIFTALYIMIELVLRTADFYGYLGDQIDEEEEEKKKTR